MLKPGFFHLVAAVGMAAFAIYLSFYTLIGAAFVAIGAFVAATHWKAVRSRLMEF